MGDLVIRRLLVGSSEEVPFGGLEGDIGPSSHFSGFFPFELVVFDVGFLDGGGDEGPLSPGVAFESCFFQPALSPLSLQIHSFVELVDMHLPDLVRVDLSLCGVGMAVCRVVVIGGPSAPKRSWLVEVADEVML